MNTAHKKRIWGQRWNLSVLAVVLVLILSLLPTHRAHAFLDDIAGKAVGTLVFVVNYILSLIAAVAIMVEAWFIGVILQMSNNVVNVDIVQAGFSVSLSLANLGFVLGIIFIAIATIIRYQTYGIKQILWKLILMAILVNFGLVIAGAIIGFSNTLTNYFMRVFPGQGGGYFAFADKMASIFQPQGLISPKTNAEGIGASIENAAAATGSALGNILQNIAGLVFGLVGLTMIIVVLALFIVMLLIRYVYFVILLILLPLAWLCYVFPALSSNYHKWWSQFFRWCFFAPVVLFFVYLVIMAGDAMTGSTGILGGVPISNFSSTSQDTVIAGLSNFFGSLLTPILTTFLKDVVLVALTMGGILAANSLGIAGAGMAMSAATRVTGAMQGFAVKQGKKGLSRMVPTGTKEALQRGEAKGLGRFMPRRLQTLAGRGLERVERVGGADLVDKEAGWAREMAKDKKMAGRLQAGSLSREKRLALAKAMYDNNDFDEHPIINGMPRDEWIDQNQAVFESYQQSKLQKDISKSQPSTPLGRKAAKAQGEEVAKEKSGIDPLDKEIAELGDKEKKIEQFGRYVESVVKRNPNETVTDVDGAVTGKAGTQMKAADFEDVAASAWTNAGLRKAEAEKERNEIMEEARGRATITDEEGKYGPQGGKVKAKDVLYAETDKKWATEIKPGDVRNQYPNEIFNKGKRGGYDAATADILAEATARAMARYTPQYAGAEIPSMRGDSLEVFAGLYRQQLRELEEIAKNTGDRDLADKIRNNSKAFERTIYYAMSRVSGGGYPTRGHEEETPPAAAPAGGGK